MQWILQTHLDTFPISQFTMTCKIHYIEEVIKVWSCTHASNIEDHSDNKTSPERSCYKKTEKRYSQ